MAVLAAPLVIPFAEALGLSVAILGMDKASDKVNQFIKDNPEESMKIFQMIMPAQGIANALKNKSSEEVEEKISLEDLEGMSDEEAQDLSKEDKAELMKQAGKSGGKNKRQTMIDISEKLGLSGEGKDKQDIEYEIDERYDEGGVEEVSKPKFDYKKFFKKRYADGGAIGIEVLFEPKRKDFNTGGKATTQDYTNALQKVSAGTTYQQQAQAKEYARNEAANELRAAIRGGDVALDNFLQSAGPGVHAKYRSVFPDSRPGRNKQGAFVDTYKSMNELLLNELVGAKLQPTQYSQSKVNERREKEFADYMQNLIASTYGTADDYKAEAMTLGMPTAAYFDYLTTSDPKDVMTNYDTLSRDPYFDPKTYVPTDYSNPETPRPPSPYEVYFQRELQNQIGAGIPVGQRIQQGQVMGLPTLLTGPGSQMGPGYEAYADVVARNKKMLGLKDGGRVGLFMGGDPLTGQALSIYDSMKAYDFTDQQIADALAAQGLYTPTGGGGGGGGNEQVTGIIGTQLNRGDDSVTSIAPGTLQKQYQAQLNNPINNFLYETGAKIKASQPYQKSMNLGAMAAGALSGIPGLGFLLDKLGKDGNFNRGNIREMNTPKTLDATKFSDTSGINTDFGGVTVDDLGRIVQTGDYLTAENIMAGYNTGFDLTGTAFDRIDKITSRGPLSDYNRRKVKALKDFAAASAKSRKDALQKDIERAQKIKDEAARAAAVERARVKSISEGYGGHDDSPGATGPTAAGAGMGVGGGYASDYGFLKDGGLATMFKEKR